MHRRVVARENRISKLVKSNSFSNLDITPLGEQISVLQTKISELLSENEDLQESLRRSCSLGQKFKDDSVLLAEKVETSKLECKNLKIRLRRKKKKVEELERIVHKQLKRINNFGLQLDKRTRKYKRAVQKRKLVQASLDRVMRNNKKLKLKVRDLEMEQRGWKLERREHQNRQQSDSDIIANLRLSISRTKEKRPAAQQSRSPSPSYMQMKKRRASLGIAPYSFLMAGTSNSFTQNHPSLDRFQRRKSINHFTNYSSIEGIRRKSNVGAPPNTPCVIENDFANRVERPRLEIPRKKTLSGAKCLQIQENAKASPSPDSSSSNSNNHGPKKQNSSRHSSISSIFSDSTNGSQNECVGELDNSLSLVEQLNRFSMTSNTNTHAPNNVNVPGGALTGGGGGGLRCSQKEEKVEVDLEQKEAKKAVVDKELLYAKAQRDLVEQLGLMDMYTHGKSPLHTGTPNTTPNSKKVRQELKRKKEKSGWLRKVGRRFSLFF